MLRYNHQNELYHHGIKGQRWGVRRYQNEDGSLTKEGTSHLKKLKSDYKNEDFTLKKNTTINRVGSKDEVDNNKRTYVSYTDDDKQRYINYAESLNAQYKMELKSLSSIKVAKGKSTVDAFSDMLQKYTPEEFVDEFCPKQYRTVKKLFSSYEEETQYSKNRRKERSDIYENALNDKESFDKAYTRFTMDIMADTSISNAYFKNLSDKGYQAMYDYNDRKAADSPLIVFDRGKNLKTTSVSEISVRDVDASIEYLRKKGLIDDY